MPRSTIRNQVGDRLRGLAPGAGRRGALGLALIACLVVGAAGCRGEDEAIVADASGGSAIAEEASDPSPTAAAGGGGTISVANDAGAGDVAASVAAAVAAQVAAETVAGAAPQAGGEAALDPEVVALVEEIAAEVAYDVAIDAVYEVLEADPAWGRGGPSTWEELVPLLLAMLLGGAGLDLAGLDDDWASAEPVAEEPAAMATPPGSAVDGAPAPVALAGIKDMEIRVLESNPPQFIVDLVTVQPDGCHTLLGREAAQVGWESAQVGDTIAIAVLNEVAQGVDCTPTEGTTKVSIPLGSDFTQGRTYTVVVNGELRTFVGQ